MGLAKTVASGSPQHYRPAITYGCSIRIFSSRPSPDLEPNRILGGFDDAGGTATLVPSATLPPRRNVIGLPRSKSSRASVLPLSVCWTRVLCRSPSRHDLESAGMWSPGPWSRTAPPRLRGGGIPPGPPASPGGMAPGGIPGAPAGATGGGTAGRGGTTGGATGIGGRCAPCGATITLVTFLPLP